MTLLHDVVATSAEVAGTRARKAKVASLAALLAELEPDEVRPAVGFLTGVPQQGRIGVGWRTLQAAVDVASAAAPSVSVGEIDAALDRLAGTSGPGSVAARDALLRDLFARLTEGERAFVFGLLTGELRQGALEGVMAEAIATAAAVPAATVRRAAMFAGDLGRIAALARSDGVEGLEAIGLEVLRPIQPMLAATSATVAEALAETGRASVEWKLDGARIQTHRRGDEVRIFTRNLNAVTDRLPGVVAAVRGLPVESVVLDGEAIGLDDAGRPRHFQDTISAFADERSAAGAGLQALFFDVLHVDGEDLLDRSLEERRDVLARVADRLRVPAIVTADVAEAEAFAGESLAAGHEGVMVKALSSPYAAGRRGGAWRKVKPVRTLDLVVLAVEWGHGRRRGWLSNLWLGARDPEGGFVMVGKTFKGLTDELLRWQTERFQELAVEDDGHVVHVRPLQVVEIALDGVQRSPRYPGGVALRFARVRGYRPDKDPTDADTIETVRALLPGADTSA
jgi:DNA ligase-1